MKPVIAVVGAQVGDEGKGKIIDWLVDLLEIDIVIRGQGGDNAGHTIWFEGVKHVLHIVPSGIFRPGTTCVIGAGTVVSPSGFLKEAKALLNAGISLDKLIISERAQLILPYHRALDKADEERRGAKSIGSTQKGISPAYQDAVARTGLRAGLLRDMRRFRRELLAVLPWKNRLLVDLYGAKNVTVDEVMADVEPAARLLSGNIRDTVSLVQDALATDKQILLEAQLGVMKDLLYGDYPYVTGSSPTTAGLCLGAGIPPTAIGRVIGVAKAYNTAVGAGPFVSELVRPQVRLANKIRKAGTEFGATTGRPRRIGGFDAPAIRYAVAVAGLTELILTKLDVLGCVEEIPYCPTYVLPGGRVTNRIEGIDTSFVAKPRWSYHPSWQSDISAARTIEELPPEAQTYIYALHQLVGLPISYVSVGYERDAIIPWRHRLPHVRS